MLTITSENESFARLNAPRQIIDQIKEILQFRPDGYMFDPRFKAGLWDGWIRPIDGHGVFHKGLLFKVCKTLEELGYTDYAINEKDFVQFYEPAINITNLEITDADGNIIQPHDYQESAVNWALENKRGIVIAPTGAGKSLIIYLTIQSLLQSKRYKKILVLVPTVSLTTQLFSDFDEYSHSNGLKVENYVHKISSGKDKQSHLAVYISTWQSIYNIKDKSYFEQFDAVFVDETHTADSSSITKILNSCTNARFRIGLTGTLKNCKTHITALTGLLGESYQVTTTKELMDRGILTNLEISAILLKHAELPKVEYKDEMDIIVAHSKRNKFIASITELHKDENYLILYQYVQKHGKPLYEYLTKKYPNKQVLLVNGQIKAEVRENIRKITEQNNNVIIVASYQTYQHGINIKNLHNVIFASPSKSMIRVFQSIGRALRKHSSKKVARLYDLADDFTGDKRKTKNYTLSHFEERIKMYMEQDFKIKYTELDFK